jgi:RNA polymerase sigma-70 factor (sigma-E family)
VDHDDLRDFLRSRLHRLSGTAYLLTGDHHEAEDLLQNALVKVADKWHRIARTDDPDAYVWRLLYNEHISTWRRLTRRVTTVATRDLPDRPSDGDLAGGAVRRLVIEQALARLTPKQRAVIVLRYFQDLSESAAADVLGCSVGTVKSQTSHALRRLREISPELELLVTEDEGVRA